MVLGRGQAIYTGQHCMGQRHLEGLPGWGSTSGEPWRFAKIEQTVRRARLSEQWDSLNCTWSFHVGRASIWWTGRNSLKSWRGSDITQPTWESKKGGKNKNICFLPSASQILVLFSQLKYRTYNPLILTASIVNKNLRGWSSENKPKAHSYNDLLFTKNSHFS